MLIYLGGPMRGYERFNFDAFEEAARNLQSPLFRHEVISPHWHDLDLAREHLRRAQNVPYDDGVEPTDQEVWDAATNTEEPLLKYEELMGWDLMQVLVVDALVMLPGWEKSQGATTEVLVGHKHGKPVYEYKGKGSSAVLRGLSFHKFDISDFVIRCDG